MSRCSFTSVTTYLSFSKVSLWLKALQLLGGIYTTGRLLPDDAGGRAPDCGETQLGPHHHQVNNKEHQKILEVKATSRLHEQSQYGYNKKLMLDDRSCAFLLVSGNWSKSPVKGFLRATLWGLHVAFPFKISQYSLSVLGKTIHHSSFVPLFRYSYRHAFHTELSISLFHCLHISVSAHLTVADECIR